MTTKHVYICDHCSTQFDTPCDEHEARCLAEKERRALAEKIAARIEPLNTIMLGETTSDPMGAKINGQLFLLPSRLTKQIVASLAMSSELVSTSAKPTDRDAALIKRANEILSA